MVISVVKKRQFFKWLLVLFKKRSSWRLSGCFKTGSFGWLLLWLKEGSFGWLLGRLQRLTYG